MKTIKHALICFSITTKNKMVLLSSEFLGLKKSWLTLMESTNNFKASNWLYLTHKCKIVSFPSSTIQNWVRLHIDQLLHDINSSSHCYIVERNSPIFRTKLAFAPFYQTIQHFAPFPKVIREMPLFWYSIFSKSS